MIHAVWSRSATAAVIASGVLGIILGLLALGSFLDPIVLSFPEDSTQLQLCLTGWRLVIITEHGQYKPYHPGWSIGYTPAIDASIDLRWKNASVQQHNWGFAFARGHVLGGDEMMLLAGPWPLAIIILLLPPALWLRSRHRRERAARTLCCPQCGYNLVECRKRCSECGWRIPYSLDLFMALRRDARKSAPKGRTDIFLRR
jgi:hypothetical protein